MPNPTNDKNINAHWDAIQLIPQKEIVTTPNGRAAFDQMAGSIIKNTTISNNIIIGYKTKLPGIFMSDGLAKDVKIENNTLLTKGNHSITLTGVVGNQSKINNNSFLKFSDTPTPVIQLDPMRIGGHMLSEGMVYVTDFADSVVNYGVVEHMGNKIYTMPDTEKANVAKGIINKDKSTAVSEVEFSDSRKSIPESYKRFSVKLTNFKYTDYKSALLNTTITSFIANDSSGLTGLKEFLNNNSTNSHAIAASNLLNDSSKHSTPITMLQSTLLRVWVMKRIALRHGTIKKPKLSEAYTKVWEDVFDNYLLYGLSYS